MLEKMSQQNGRKAREMLMMLDGIKQEKKTYTLYNDDWQYRKKKENGDG